MIDFQRVQYIFVIDLGYRTSSGFARGPTWTIGVLISHVRGTQSQFRSVCLRPQQTWFMWPYQQNCKVVSHTEYIYIYVYIYVYIYIYLSIYLPQILVIKKPTLKIEHQLPWLCEIYRKVTGWNSQWWTEGAVSQPQARIIIPNLIVS